MLCGKIIVIGVTASVAVYKTGELIRRLKELGAEVFVMMSYSATQLISPQLLAVLSGHEVLTSLFGPNEGMKHIELAKKADVLLVCPATANMIGKLAHGLADDVISTTVLATKAPILICPAMNPTMWGNQLVQNNVERLQKAGMKIVPPDSGEMACGDVGEGRLAEIETILEMIKVALTPQDLLGKKILITAGPTIERLDPARYISNFSSGKMGLALARVAARRGAEVIVIGNKELGIMNNESGIKNQELRIKKIDVESAEEMYEATIKNIAEQDVFISAAAVCDFRPEIFSDSKIKKAKFGEKYHFELQQTKDILAAVIKKRGREKKPFLVGFALESEDVFQNAKNKFKHKPVDLLVVNSVDNLGSDEKKVWLVTGKKEKEWPLMPVEAVAREILNKVLICN